MFEYRYLIIVIVAMIIFAIVEWERTKVIIYNMMLRAKDLAKDKVLNGGQAQEDWVVSKLLIILPKPLLLFLNEQTLRTIVRYLYRKGLDYLDDGKFNDSLKK